MQNLNVILSTLLLCGIPQALYAGGCRVVQKRVVKAVVVQPEPVIILSTVFVPAYSASYAPQAVLVSPAPTYPLAAAARITPADRLPVQGEQEQRLMPEINAELSVERIFAARCAACHDKVQAAAKGSGFVLLESGKLPSKLSALYVAKIAALIAQDKMPKTAAKLPAIEKQAIYAWILNLQTKE